MCSISMNYGAEPADQVVRYSLEGMEYSLKITGNVAKHVAVFIAAALKDQKKTRGKTRLTRMLKEQRPMKFFTVPGDRLKEFAKEAKASPSGNWKGFKVIRTGNYSSDSKRGSSS